MSCLFLQEMSQSCRLFGRKNLAYLRGGAAGGHQAPSPRDQPLSLFAADQAPSQHSKIFGYTSNEMMAAHKDAVVIANFQQNNR